MNTIFECLYMLFGLEKGHQLSTYTTIGEMGVHTKCVQLLTVGGGVTPYVYVRTYTISYQVFGSTFVL